MKTVLLTTSPHQRSPSRDLTRQKKKRKKEEKEGEEKDLVTDAQDSLLLHQEKSSSDAVLAQEGPGEAKTVLK